jgi:hypothetical protein
VSVFASAGLGADPVVLDRMVRDAYEDELLGDDAPTLRAYES